MNAELAATPLRPRLLETALWGGLAVAILDIANAMIFWAIARGTSPARILQSVAAGLLGKDAFSGGAATAVLGAVLHVFIACTIALVFALACRLVPALLRQPFVSGPIYGGAVYVVMNHVVVPLSQANPPPFLPVWFTINFIGHMVLVGLPVAIVARASARRAARQGEAA